MLYYKNLTKADSTLKFEDIEEKLIAQFRQKGNSRELDALTKALLADNTPREAIAQHLANKLDKNFWDAESQARSANWRQFLKKEKLPVRFQPHPEWHDEFLLKALLVDDPR